MNIYFSFFFFPVLAASYFVYWFLCRSVTQKNILIAGFSTLVMALLHPVYALVVLLFSYTVHLLLRGRRAGKVSGKAFLLTVICGGLAIMLSGKYALVIRDLLFVEDNPFFSYFMMPLGVSYFFFRIVQYSFDHYRGLIQDTSFLNLYVFVTFLPIIPAGPVESYQNFYGGRELFLAGDEHLGGMGRIILGMAKKMIISDFIFDQFLMVSRNAVFLSPDGYSFWATPSSLAGTYALLLYGRAFFDMSACADIAIGCSRLFGFSISENLNKPYLSRNLSDFWQRWHITVSSWCRNNVFFPVFGMTKKVWVGLLCSMIVMGLWHRISLQWLTWALLHGAALCAVYFLGVARLKRPWLKKMSTQSWYFLSAWLFTQLFVATSHILTLPVSYYDACKTVLLALPFMVCAFGAGLLAAMAAYYIYNRVRRRLDAIAGH